MPKPIQALIWLAHYLIRRWPLRMVGIDEWKQTKASVVFVSYLFNLSSVHLKEGKFESNHWTKLPKQLQVNNCKTNWIHIYIEDKLLPTAKRAAKSIKKFNKNHKNFQVHVTLDTFLSLKIVSKTLVDWVMLIRKSAGVSNALACKDVIWPLIEEDWKKSILGDSAVSTLLEYNLMESAINMLPRQDKGIYLQENQGWEFGFIQIWRKRKNGVLIGTPHSTVRYWDLRYFFDSRHYHDSGLNSLPLPDKIAVNGLAAKKQYLKGGYPENKIVVVEALRYYHLDKIVSKYVKNNLKESKLNILIVLDFLNKNIEYQLSLLSKSLNLLTCKVHLIVKPHPANRINTENYPELEMEVTTESIASCMHRCDIVFASNATSAAVDAYCLGGRVIVVNNPETLNQSPLRGIRSVSFVSTPKDLASALSNVNKINQEPINKNDFFYKNKFRREKISFPYSVTILRNLKRNYGIINQARKSKKIKSKNQETTKIPWDLMSIIMKINLDWRIKLFKDKNTIILFKKIIEEYVDYSKQQNFRPIFVFLPQKDDILFIKQKYHFYQEFINELMKINNLISIDITKKLIEEENLDKLYSDDNWYGGHYSKEGNKKIAKFIFSELAI